MKCNNFDNIALLVDGALSNDAVKDLEDHISSCQDCRNIYDTLLSTRVFLKDEVIADMRIDNNVLNTIDKNRYTHNKNKYLLFRGFAAFKGLLKPGAAILLVCTALLYLGYVKYYSKEPVPVPPTFSEAPSGAVNMLILGTDSYLSTDTILLLNYDPTSAQMNILSIPRDTAVNLNGSQTKLNGICNYKGTDAVKKVVGDLLKVDIKYYVNINTSVIQKSIDLLDGIDYNSPVDLDYDDPSQDLHIHIKKGQNHLTGKQALELIRFRKPSHMTNELKKYYDGSDLKRIEAQQGIMKAFMEQKLNISYVSKIDELIKIIFPEIKTDISLRDTLNLVKNLYKSDPNEVNIFTLSGKSDSRFNYIIDQDAAQSLIKSYFQSGM